MNVIEQTENIYNHLCDDLSRNIFENRLLYSLTGRYNFINNAVTASFGEAVLKKYRDALYSNFEKYSNNDIIVYGAGFIGTQVVFLCDKIRIVAFCDSEAKKHGSMFAGYKVISPAQLKEEHSDAFVVVAVAGSKAIAEITEALLNLGFQENQILNLMHIYKLTSINTRHLRDGQYFDPEIILSRISKDEVFINGGCCDCYTDIQFAKLCKNEYRKIIAFEPNPKQYPICVENSKSIPNITIHPYGLWNESTELSFDNGGSAGGAHVSDAAKSDEVKIKTVRLDDILNGEAATFIKLDVEGAELNALKGAEQTILKYRPKLAICLYHKREDMWEIPAYILSLYDDYKFYIRHYSFGNGETVLYAI